MKGAVSFLGLSLWGVKKVVSLKVPTTSVLPSILQVSAFELPHCIALSDHFVLI